MDLAADLAPPDALRAPQSESADAMKVARPPHRGPMRPAALASTRRRLSGATLAARFRAIDILAMAAVTALALWSGRADALLSTPLRAALPPALGAALTLWALKLIRAYDFAHRESWPRHFGKVLIAGAAGCSATLVTAFLFGAELQVGVRWSLLGLTALLGVHMIDWIKVRQWRASGLLTPNVVVVGATANASRLIEGALNARDAAILGVFDDRISRIPDQIHGVPVLGTTNALLSHKLLPFIDRIIITVTPSAQERVRELIERLKYLPNAVTLFMDVEGFDAQRATLSRLADAPLTQVSGVRQDDAKAGTKRLQDLVLSALALVVATPLMLATALAVRLDSPGPILFRQRRFGFNSEVIDVWKFRSMRHETTDHLAARQVSRHDDRVTRVGRFIRRFSLDELPQLFNVVKGEMSLVGPRPHAIGMKTAGEDSARLVAEYAWRHRMKPGLTGWAQINGSIGAVDTPELVRRRVTLDVEYIERQSFWFDLYIIAMTIPAMIGVRNVVR